jgi:hypothetical protein
MSGATAIADTIANTGEWMWASARSIEKGEPFLVYAYAARPNRKWLFDMHLEEPGEAPSFGWDTPHIYVPMSKIFAEVYAECKQLLGFSGSPLGEF